MTQKSKFSVKRKFGNKGEDIVCNHLKRTGYSIIDRNYLKKWGELDVVAFKDEIYYFIEVKTVSRDLSVIRETSNSFRPEENVHINKLARLKRMIQTYIAEKNIENRIWQFSVAILFLDVKNHLARLTHLKDIIID